MNTLSSTILTNMSLPTSPMEWCILIIGLLGAICIASFSTPALIKILKTKDTTWVSILMYLILASGSLCFMLNGILSMINDMENTFTSLIGVTLANVISFLLAFTTLLIKFCHIARAKKLGISEAELCKKLAEKKTNKKASASTSTTVKAEPAKAKTTSASKTKKVGATKKVSSTTKTVSKSKTKKA